MTNYQDACQAFDFRHPRQLLNGPDNEIFDYNITVAAIEERGFVVRKKRKRETQTLTDLDASRVECKISDSSSVKRSKYNYSSEQSYLVPTRQSNNSIRNSGSSNYLPNPSSLVYNSLGNKEPTRNISNASYSTTFTKELQRVNTSQTIEPRVAHFMNNLHPMPEPTNLPILYQQMQVPAPQSQSLLPQLPQINHSTPPTRSKPQNTDVPAVTTSIATNGTNPTATTSKTRTKSIQFEFLMVDPSVTPKKKKRPKLPPQVTKILLDWLYAHQHCPYPTEAEKAALITATRLSRAQLNNWFSNSRRRILMYDSSSRPK